MLIHALPVAGGIVALSPLPGLDGDYAGDLRHLTEWRPAMVLSFATGVELLAAGAETLGQDVRDHGSLWEHLPIEDMGAPDPGFDAIWRPVSEKVRRALTGGGRVLVHCKAGCGRSGMAALRLMIEAGEAPDDALARLRSVRPCAVETREQMAWAVAAERQPALFMRHAD